MQLAIHATPEQATRAAADLLETVLRSPPTRRLMVAGGNTPLALYAEIARRHLPLADLEVVILDEYVGVPLEDPRTCTNLLRRTVTEAWGIDPGRFHGLSSLPGDALAVVRAHEQRIARTGGLDAVILGLGPNGHLGFNEPGSAPDSRARLLDLEATSIAANRKWFGGEHAPAQGATVGLSTILAARRVILLAFGEAKAPAARAMLEGPRAARCPASWLQSHPAVTIFLDEAAASGLRRR